MTMKAKNRPSAKPTKRTAASPGFTVGAGRFEKISAVEGIKVSGQMRKDLRTARTMPEAKSRAYLAGKYGK